MKLYAIKLIPKGKEAKDITDVELNYNHPPKQELSLNYSRYQTVYSDALYSFSLIDADDNQNNNDYEIRKILLNEEEVPFRYNETENVYEFIDSEGNPTCPFTELFGFVSITVVIQGDNEVSAYYTKPLSIIIHKDQKQNDIERMINYICLHQDVILFSDNTQMIENSNQIITFEKKLALAEDILNIYKESYGYFKTNCRFKVIVSHTVDNINKLNVLSNETIEYIATHPEYIEKVLSDKGIKIKGETYLPKKTLIQRNKNTVNIYENQVVVGFLRTIIRELEVMKVEANELIKSSKQLITQEIDGYIHSSYHIISRSEGKLEDSNKRLSEIHSEFLKMLMYYQSILPVDQLDFSMLPKPSAILLSVPQYNSIYLHIQKWFEFGMYNLEREKFILSLKDKTEIYEIYILLQIIDDILKKGYTLLNSSKFNYKMNEFSLYKNTFCKNTFVFERDEDILTLYYQPVIYDGNRFPSNGINLLRNNSFSVTDKTFYDKKSDSYYYTPDYIIKKETESSTEYYIADAKYSNIYDIERYQLMPIAYKYLISVSPRKNENIKGVYIIYGKTNESEKEKNIFDLYGSYNQDKPRITLIPKE